MAGVVSSPPSDRINDSVARRRFLHPNEAILAVLRRGRVHMQRREEDEGPRVVYKIDVMSG
jgi:hypothetical protein